MSRGMAQRIAVTGPLPVALLAQAITSAGPVAAAGTQAAAASFQVTVDAGQHVSVSAADVPLQALLGAFASRTGARVQVAPEAREIPVSVEFDALPAESALARLLSGTSYVVVRGDTAGEPALALFVTGVRGDEPPPRAVAAASTSAPSDADTETRAPASDIMDVDLARLLVRVHGLEEAFEKAARGAPLSEIERERIVEFFAR